MKTVDIDKLLYEASHNATLFQSEYFSLIYSFNHDIQALLAYPGGKKKMEEDLNDIFNNYLTKNNHYNTYIDGFFGMGGSFRALNDSLYNHGVRKVIVNEINPCISRMHENIRNSPQKMIDYFLEFMRTEIVIPHKKLYISADELLKIKKIMRKRFYSLQNKQMFGVETSTLMIMLSAFNYSGIVNFTKDGSISFGTPIYEYTDVEDFFYKTIKRINTYSHLYKRFEMKFINSDYLTLYKHYKKESHTLWNIDPVYLEENKRKYNKDEISNLEDSYLIGCGIDYSQKRFNHKGVLESLKDIDFIYNNNTHPLLHHYIQEFDLQSKPFIRKENTGSKKGKKVKEVEELTLYQTNYNKSANNLITSKPTQECA